jgi:hypothetical protein
MPPLRESRLGSALCALVLFPVLAHAGPLYVNCRGHRGLTQIQKAINLLQQTETSGSNTILVSGSCKENITIQSMDNLTLTAQNGASFTDASNGTADVMDVIDSWRVSINGFTINGITNNGGAGVFLGDLSFAFFGVNSNVTGNAGGTDVVCDTQYSATRGALTNIGGTTNCVKP